MNSSMSNIHDRVFSFLNRRVPLAFLIFLLLCLPTFGQTTQTCPWLNAATAGDFLGGPVGKAMATSTAKVASKVVPARPLNDDVTCEFVRHAGDTIATLRIEVHTVNQPEASFASYAAHCGMHAILQTGIGNEAILCKRKSGHRISSYLVGRVRNRIFLVELRTNDPKIEESMLLEEANEVSQQVAGILF